MVRQKLRRQTGEPVGALLESVRRLLAGEINAERKAVAEGMLEQLLLLKAGIQEPRPGAGGVNGERRVGADLNPERREQIKE
jgi:hypothetical protein